MDQVFSIDHSSSPLICGYHRFHVVSQTKENSRKLKPHSTVFPALQLSPSRHTLSSLALVPETLSQARGLQYLRPRRCLPASYLDSRQPPMNLDSALDLDRSPKNPPSPLKEINCYFITTTSYSSSSRSTYAIPRQASQFCMLELDELELTAPFRTSSLEHLSQAPSSSLSVLSAQVLTCLGIPWKTPWDSCHARVYFIAHRSRFAIPAIGSMLELQRLRPPNAPPLRTSSTFEKQ